MERLPVYRSGQSVGTLELEQDGLYWRMSAVCRGAPLERLWIHTAGRRVCLGPLEPENGLLVCRGRISCAALGHEAVTHAVVVPGSSSWDSLDSVALFGRLFSDALACGSEVALRFDPEGPFPLPGQFCLCRVAALQGRWYVIVSRPADEKNKKSTN